MDQTVEGVMTLEQFVPFAHVILQMIYANSYPDNVCTILSVIIVVTSLNQVPKSNGWLSYDAYFWFGGLI